MRIRISKTFPVPSKVKRDTMTDALRTVLMRMVPGDSFLLPEPTKKNLALLYNLRDRAKKTGKPAPPFITRVVSGKRVRVWRVDNDKA